MLKCSVLFVAMATTLAIEDTTTIGSYNAEQMEKIGNDDNKGPTAFDIIREMDKKLNQLTNTVKQQGMKIVEMGKQIDEMKTTIQKQTNEIADFGKERKILNEV